MATVDVPTILKGLVGGITTERSVINTLPNQLASTARNVEVLRDGSFRPRRGADFIGLSDLGNYMSTTRTTTTSAETTQESPSGIYAVFRTSTGSIVERDIIFQNNTFKILHHSNLKNFDAPDQTIDPGDRVNTEQKFYTVSFVFADNKVFFAGKKIQPGYLYLSSDDSTLSIAYLSLHTRDIDNATTTSSRVTYSGKYYECVEAHTSTATDVSGTNTYGELIFNRYWMELDNTAIPGGASAWASSTAYSTNIVKASDKFAALASINPHAVWFWNNRLWLATDSKVYYSQIAVNIENAKTNVIPTGVHEFSLFLQEADPFNTADPDPVASDGGTYSPSIGNVWQIIGTEESLFVGTSQNIVEIRGATASFSHTDFKSGEVVHQGINGVGNMVLADTKVIVFANDDIFTTSDESRYTQSALTKFDSIGSHSIKTYYTAIPKLNKGTGRAVYSSTKEKIYFFHNGTSTSFDASYRTIPGQSGYTTDILVLDLSPLSRKADGKTGVDQPLVQSNLEIWSYEDHATSGGIYIAFPYTSAPTTPSANNVVANAVQVVVSGSSVIVSQLSGAEEGSDEIVIIAMERIVSGSTLTIKTGLGKLESANVRDWELDATRVLDYTVNADLGTQVFEDITYKKAVRYLVFVMEKLTDGTGSCLCRTAFNFSLPTAAGEGTGKTSGQTEIYFDTKTIGSSGSVSMTNYGAVTYKLRVLGRGEAFQVSLENTPGKDFKVLGWGELVKTKRR